MTHSSLPWAQTIIRFGMGLTRVAEKNWHCFWIGHHVIFHHYIRTIRDGEVTREVPKSYVI